jgi:hypothetical protein
MKTINKLNGNLRVAVLLAIGLFSQLSAHAESNTAIQAGTKVTSEFAWVDVFENKDYLNAAPISFKDEGTGIMVNLEIALPVNLLTEFVDPKLFFKVKRIDKETDEIGAIITGERVGKSTPTIDVGTIRFKHSVFVRYGYPHTIRFSGSNMRIEISADYGEKAPVISIEDQDSSK